MWVNFMLPDRANATYRNTLIVSNCSIAADTSVVNVIVANDKETVRAAKRTTPMECRVPKPSATVIFSTFYYIIILLRPSRARCCSLHAHYSPA